MSAGVAGAIIGATGALLAVGITALAARGLEIRRQRNEVVAAAIAELFSGLAESSLGDQQKGMLLYARAKARLLTYAPAAVVEALLAFERAGGSGANPASQRAIATLARAARDAAGVEEQVSDADALELLFGSSSSGQSS